MHIHKCKELGEILMLLKKTKSLCNHKNAFGESEEYPNAACCTINSKEWLGCHDIILSSGGYFDHTCFSYVCY